MPAIIRQFVESLARRPAVFDALRWMLEGGYSGHRQLIARELANRPGRVLDIGCGTGIYARFFAPDRYTGIDLSAGYVAAAAAKYPDHSFLAMDARGLAFAAESFDATFISGVLHHLSDEDALAVIRSAARVLKPDGVLVVWEDIPSRQWWNLVGHAVHALDLGSNIRTPDGYAALLSREVSVNRTTLMRSGFMDYATFVCLRM